MQKPDIEAEEEEQSTPIVEMSSPEPEQEVVEVVEIKQEVVEEKAKEVVKPAMVDIFSIEEKQAMQALADMGRIFDDEDEAKMVKLTEDLTAWINKYAPTFEDPEALLF
jgi:predicted outer membrane protein